VSIFIAPIGIRRLVMAAKAVARASRKPVLLDPGPLVTDLLITAGLDDSIARAIASLLEDRFNFPALQATPAIGGLSNPRLLRST
jgi:hypothetical protein